VFHCTHACLSFFILQITCISTTIISRATSHVLTLQIFVKSPVTTSPIIHAVPFNDLMYSRGVILYRIVYTIGLKCTIFSLFYFKLCHIVELSYDDSNLITNR
jgi:hypothetical protein